LGYDEFFCQVVLYRNEKKMNGGIFLFWKSSKKSKEPLFDLCAPLQIPKSNNLYYNTEMSTYHLNFFNVVG